MRASALLSRIGIIVIACLAASFAAGLVVSLAVLIPQLGDLALIPLERGGWSVIATFAAVFISGQALGPTLLVIACAESFSIRALLFYALAGAMLGAVLALGFEHWDLAAISVNGFARRELEIMVAAGIVAGFVYWAMAGRKAGAWRESGSDDPQRHSRLR